MADFRRRPLTLLALQLGRLLCGCGSILLLWALWLAVSGGVTFAVFGIHVSGNIRRPLLNGSLLMASGLVAGNLCQGFLDPGGQRRLRAAAIAATLATLALGFVYGAFVAGGSDAYGYVSQAALWRQGTLVVDAPLAATASWPDAAASLAPLGYQPGPVRGTIVPTYPPGLPMVMGVAQLLGGERGAYVVVPVLGAVAVWLTYLLGTTLDSAAAGVLAAVLLVASPPFLMQLMLPMSDVPAMTWWLAAFVAATRPSRRAAVASATAAALAIATRPNLVVLAPVVAIVAATAATESQERWRRVAIWAAVASLGPLAIAATNWRLYGSPLRSGYGALGSLYGFAYAATNIRQYGGWLLDMQTAFIVVGIAAPLVLRRAGNRRAAVLARSLLGAAAIVALSYLWYVPFDNWTYLRFLLPAYPLLLVAASVVTVRALAPFARRPSLVTALALLLLCHGFWQGRAVFRVGREEARYRAAARLAEGLPANAVIIANLHSGSLRYYTHRVTLRYEALGADGYGVAIEHLAQQGYPVYAVLEESEIAAFRQRYIGSADLSWLDRPPLASVDARVRLYALPQRSS